MVAVEQRSPIEVVVPGLRGRVLSALVRAGRPVTIRGLTRMAGSSSPSGVQKALRALVADGLARQLTDEPGAHLFELRRSALSRALRALEATHEALPEVIAERVAGWREQPRAVVLFGPIATGAVATQVDLLIVWREARPQPWGGDLLLLHHIVTESAGLPLVLEEWWSEDWEDAFEGGHPLARRIALEGTHVAGEGLRMLTRAWMWR